MDRKKNPITRNELEDELSRLPESQGAELRRTWELLGRLPAAAAGDVPSLDEAWTDLQERIQAKPRSPRPRPDRAARRSAWSRRRTTYVAAAVLLVGLALWIWQLPITTSAPAGGFSSVTLADGSIVNLNSETRLRYRPRNLPLFSDSRRQVQLDGEAFFEVKPGERPFVVETGAALVEVLGTEFNVRAHVSRADSTTEVTLASGRVRVTARDDHTRTVVLSRPGEMARVLPDAGPDSSLATEMMALDYVLAWRRKAFAAIDRPVLSILAELERRYAVRIDVEGDLAFDESMTLLYGPGTTPDRILHDVCLVHGCRYRTTSGGYALYRPSRDSNR